MAKPINLPQPATLLHSGEPRSLQNQNNHRTQAYTYMDPKGSTTTANFRLFLKYNPKRGDNLFAFFGFLLLISTTCNELVDVEFVFDYDSLKALH
jgi:hypothetical protein